MAACSAPTVQRMRAMAKLHSDENDLEEVHRSRLAYFVRCRARVSALRSSVEDDALNTPAHTGLRRQIPFCAESSGGGESMASIVFRRRGIQELETEKRICH